MRSRAVATGRPVRVVAGEVSPSRASGRAVEVTDELGGEVSPASSLRFRGLRVYDQGGDEALIVGEVGVATLTPMTPTQLTANQNDWDPVDVDDATIDLDAATIIRASTDASRNLTGIVAPTAERLLILENVGAFDLVIKHNVTSTAANRFYCPNDTDVTLQKDSSIILVYDLTSARWRVVGGAGGGGSGSLIVQEDDATVDAAATTLDFGHGFDVTSSPAGEANIAVDESELTHNSLGGLTTGNPHTQYQPIDSDLTDIAALAPANDDVIQRKAGAWTNRTMAQLIADLAALATTFQPLDADLTAIAALSTTSFGRSILALASDTDTTKVVAPDGAGALALRAENAVNTVLSLIYAHNQFN